MKDLLLIPMDTVEHDSALCIRLVLYVRAATLIWFWIRHKDVLPIVQ